MSTLKFPQIIYFEFMSKEDLNLHCHKYTCTGHRPLSDKNTQMALIPTLFYA